MPMVRIPLPSLTGGVSRQPQIQRNPNQLEEANNVLMPLSRGVMKRPGTEFIQGGGTNGKLAVNGGSSQNYFDHWINRDSTHRFVLLVNPSLAKADSVQVYDLAGNKKTVTFVNNGAGQDPYDYITSGTPDKTDLAALSVTDTTFLLNKKVVVALGSSTATYNYAGTSVALAANAHNKASVNDFDQPPAADGEYWYAREDAIGYPAGYYVSQNHTGSGPWYKRVRTPQAGSTINALTMPIRINYIAGTDQFEVHCVDWNDRLSGDSITNPGPSIVGKKLRDMVFHLDRFFFAADEQVASSQAGDYFNLWLNNYANVGDADPVDVTMSGSSINNVQAMVAFSKALTLMTDGSRQFELRSEQQLTPSSASLVPATSYKSEPYCRPVTMGSQLYFVSENGSTSQLYEYYYSSDSANNIAVDVTVHVPGYVPTKVRRISVSPNNELLVLSPDNEKARLYFYQSYWSGNDKVQSSWFRWTFDIDTNVVIWSHAIFDNWLYILFRRPDNSFWLERAYITVPPNDVDAGGTMPFSVRIDRKVSVTGVYDSVDNVTKFTLPYIDQSINEVVLGAGWTNLAGKRFEPRNATEGGFTVLRIPGKWDSYPAFCGRRIVETLTLSQPYVRDQNGTVVNGNLQIRTMTVFHTDAGFYEVRVTPTGRDMNRHRFNAQRLGALQTLLGKVVIESSGAFVCKPMVSAAGCLIQIVNNTPLPCTITNIELVCNFVPKRTNIAQ